MPNDVNGGPLARLRYHVSGAIERGEKEAITEISARDLEAQELEDERGAELGDARRCPKHPNEKTSSPDGMFDTPCGACEYEMEMGADDQEVK